MMKRNGAALMRRKGKRRGSLDGEARWRTEQKNGWVWKRGRAEKEIRGFLLNVGWCERCVEEERWIFAG